MAATLPRINLFWLILISGVIYPKGWSMPWDWQNSNHPPIKTPKVSHPTTRSPEFFSTSTNLTGWQADTVELPCTVRNLGQFYTVSWIRERDTTVLSVGHLAFSSDNRFSVLQAGEEESAISDWSLRISNLSQQDQGIYECQINTEPKISRKVFLEIKDGESAKLPHTDLLPLKEESNGSKRIFSRGSDLRISGSKVHEGERLELECILQTVDGAVPESFMWQKDGKELSPKTRAGLSLDTEKLAGESRSRLYIAKVEVLDTGEYSCISDLARQDSVQIVIGKGQFDKTSKLLSGESTLHQHRIGSLISLLVLQKLL